MATSLYICKKVVWNSSGNSVFLTGSIPSVTVIDALIKKSIVLCW
jgi:hypothetical protein